MRKISAHFSVYYGVALTNDRAALICEATAVIKVTLNECFVALPEVVYVIPRPSCIERKFIRGSSDNRP